MTVHAPPSTDVLPCSIEAEQAILGAVLTNPDCLDALRLSTEPKHFSEDLHAKIFAAMLSLNADGKSVSIITIGAALADTELPEGVKLSAYLARLQVEATTFYGAADYADMVVETWRRRELIRAAIILQDAARAPNGPLAAAIVTEFGEATSEITLGALSSTRKSIGEAADGLLTYTEKIRKKEIASLNVPTGFADVDKITPYEAGTLWVVGARPGQGKTVWMVSSSLKVAQAGARAGRDEQAGQPGDRAFGAMAFSFEVPERQLTSRYLSALSYMHDRPIPYGSIARGDYNDEELWRLEDAFRRLRNLPLTIDCASRATVTEIRAKIRAEKKAMARRGVRLGVVFLDYLKFIKASDRYKGNRVYEVGEISANLHEIAKDEELCVVLLAQLNRALENREDKRPNLADLRESGDLEADADVVAFIHREAQHILKSAEYRQGKPEAQEQFHLLKHDAELIIGKNRAGAEDTAHLWADVSCSTLSDKGRA
jgi:replicative DNA helicase